MRIEAFGELSIVRGDGRVVISPPAAPHPRALLTLLAFHGVGGVTRERASSLLASPDSGEADGWWNAAVQVLRDWLGREHLDVAPNHLALNGPQATSDVSEFRSALAAGDLERAVQLHRNRLVDGVHHREFPEFDRWLQLQREALASDAAAALERLAEDAMRRGEALAAVRWWRQLAMQNPLNHRVAASLMEALVQAGDREGALRHARFLEAVAGERLALPGDEQVLAMARALRHEGRGARARALDDRSPGTQVDAEDRLSAFRLAISERYRLEGEVGRGGHGAVLRATDVRLQRTVAIKILHPELAPALSTRRFAREIRLVSALHHPHILPLYDSGCEGGTPFFVMPLVEGATVRDRLRREGPLPVPDAVRIARQVASALDEAHRRAIVHRDIKPENILLAGSSALVADFGIACALDGHTDTGLTAPGIAMGTPAYMSPEQAAPNAGVDGRSDVYSLGVVLFEMLTGAPPFPGESPHAVLAAHAAAPVPTARGLRPDIPAALEDAIRRALQKDPAHRYGSAADMERALEATLESTRPGAHDRADAGARTRARRRAALARGLVIALGTLLLAALTFAPVILRATRSASAPAAPSASHLNTRSIPSAPAEIRP